MNNFTQGVIIGMCFILIYRIAEMVSILEKIADKL